MLNRRLLLGLAAALPAGLARAEDVLELDWEQLIPATAVQDAVTGLVPHGGGADAPADMTEAEILGQLVTDLNGRRVKLPGFTVPLGFDGVEMREFLLVPYVGACIHVPPPPPNQIVYVTSDRPVPFGALFDPFWVTGTLTATPLHTELAQVGYRIEAERVEPYVY